MKTALTLLVISSISSAAFAQMGHDMSKNAKHVINCPVTGDNLFADYKGNRYFFCCNDCPQMFKKNPAKYAGKSHVKTPRGK